MARVCHFKNSSFSYNITQGAAEELGAPLLRETRGLSASRRLWVSDGGK